MQQELNPKKCQLILYNLLDKGMEETLHQKLYGNKYRIGGRFRREKFSWISRFRKNYTQKTKFYMVHTLFLTDSRKFNPAKYTTYTVYEAPISVHVWSCHNCMIIHACDYTIHAAMLMYNATNSLCLEYHLWVAISSGHAWSKQVQLMKKPLPWNYKP